MQMNLLFIITPYEQKATKIINHFKLPFNTITYGRGTASKSMLDFFALIESEKSIILSIFPNCFSEKIFNKFDTDMHLNEYGNGIAFSILISSSSKYIMDAYKIKKVSEEKMNEDDKNIKYHLLLTIVKEGYADKVMQVAKKHGANGGTLINGRGLSDKNSFKFFNITLEPEKDIVLIVCNQDNKNAIMNGIIEKMGIKTEAQGMCISLPIDKVLGLN